MNLEEITQKKDCKSCKKGLSKTHWPIIGLSIYMFGTSIYGTIKLIQLLFSLC